MKKRTNTDSDPKQMFDDLRRIAGTDDNELKDLIGNMMALINTDITANEMLKELNSDKDPRIYLCEELGRLNKANDRLTAKNKKLEDENMKLKSQLQVLKGK